MFPYKNLKILPIINIGTEPLLFSIGFIVFFLLIFQIMIKEYKLNNKELTYFLIIVLVFAFFFGRLFAFLLPWRGLIWFLKFFTMPSSLVSSIGLILGGAIGIYIFNKTIKTKINSYDLIDKSIFYLLISIVFFRVGCYLDGHIIGKVTNLSWCIEKFGECRHPVSLYYILSLFIIYIILFIITKIKEGKMFPGELSLLFLIFYSTMRILLSIFLLTFPIEFNYFLGSIVLLCILILNLHYSFNKKHNLLSSVQINNYFKNKTDPLLYILKKYIFK